MTKWFKPLTSTQRLGWAFASLTYGVTMIVVASQLGVPIWSYEGDAFVFGVVVQAACWLVGVVLMRVYLQDKDPTDLRDLFAMRRRPKD